MTLKLAPILSGLLLGACSVIGVRDGTEEPPYTVTAHQGPAEIRQYGPRIAAEVTIPTQNQVQARGDGFRALAGYIFGANTTRASIAMTAPVAQSDTSKPVAQSDTSKPVAQSTETIAMTAPVTQTQTAAGWTIRFFMPAKYTMDTLPNPTDPTIHLVEVPAQTMAVLRFTGSTAPEAVATQQAALLQALQNSPWQQAGDPVAWFYDPPWTLPFLRRNEVAIPVRPTP